MRQRKPRRKAWSGSQRVGYRGPRAQKFAAKLRAKQRHKRAWNREQMAKRSRRRNQGR